MRSLVAVLTCIGTGGISLATADSPSPAPAQPAASAPAAAAAAPSAPVAAPKTELLEKELLAKGYKVEMHHGEKLYCRTEEALGSRLGGKKTCSTAERLQEQQHDSREYTEQMQREQGLPTGR